MEPVGPRKIFRYKEVMGEEEEELKTKDRAYQ